MGIMKGKKLSSLLLHGQFVYPVGEEGCDKGEGIIIARCLFHFIREHKNLV